MERGRLIFGVLFLALPLLLLAGIVFLPGAAAFALALALIAILSFGFLWGIAFIDWA